MNTIDSRDIAGRRIIVTAGASGIGRAITEAFAKGGAHVCICDIDETALARTSAELPGIIAVPCDVGDPGNVATLFRAAADAWDGHLDCLVNNVGVAGQIGPIEDLSWPQWEETMRVNVGGMFLCIQAALPLFRAAGGGAIINFSTTSVRTGAVNRLPYVASKAAVHGLTLNVARELGPENISCNAILPGSVNNERNRRIMERAAADRGITYQQAVDDDLRYVSMRSQVQPSEIAAMCLHLASPASRHVSGQFIGVCGNTEWE